MWMLGVVIGLIMGAATGGVGGAFAGLVLGGVAGVALTAIMNGEIARRMAQHDAKLEHIYKSLGDIHFRLKDLEDGRPQRQAAHQPGAQAAPAVQPAPDAVAAAARMAAPASLSRAPESEHAKAAPVTPPPLPADLSLPDLPAPAPVLAAAIPEPLALAPIVDTAPVPRSDARAPAPLEPAATAPRAAVPVAPALARRNVPAPEEAAESAGPGFVARLLAGNLVAKAGVVILFFGVGFLLKYAYDHSILPPWTRLAGVALASAGLFYAGLRLLAERRLYALILMGGAFGFLYLDVFFALKWYHYIDAATGFALYMVLGVATVLTAVRMDARPLAVLGLFGAFLAPPLASTGAGNHVLLFSYYTLLNLFILGVSWFKTWRDLNLVGFGFTFFISAVWGVRSYRPELFASVEPFVVIFFLIYVAIPILFATRQKPEFKGLVDATLVFGTPIAASFMQARVAAGMGEHVLAWSAGGAAALYALLGLLIRRREHMQLLGETHLALATLFGTMTVFFALDAYPTFALWTLEGAAILWVGLRQQRWLARAFGLALQVVAALYFLGHFDQVERANPVFNDFVLGCALIAVAGWISAWLLDRHREILSDGEVLAGNFLLVWAFAWWFGGGLHEMHRHLADADVTPALLLFASVTLGLAELLGSFLPPAGWPALRRMTVLHLLGMIIAALWAATQPGHPLQGLGGLAWPLAFAVHFGMLYRQRRDGLDAGLEIRDVAGWLIAAGLATWDVAWLIHHSEYALALLWAGAGFAAAWLRQYLRDEEEQALPLSRVVLVWSLLVWGAAGWNWLADSYSGTTLFFIALGCTAASAAVFEVAGSLGRWADLRSAAVLLPAGMVLAAAALYDRHGHPLMEQGAWAWPLAFVVAWLALHRQERDDCAPLPRTQHLLLFWMLAVLLVWELEARLDLAEMALQWKRAAWGAIPAALVALTVRLAQRDLWPFREHAGLYRDVALMPLLIVLGGWSVFANLADPGIAVPVTHIPLVNPLDLTQMLVLYAGWSWARQAAADLDAQHMVVPGLGVLTFIWVNGVALRAIHYYADVPYEIGAQLASVLTQSVLSLLWTSCALVLMTWASRRGARTPWMVGAALLGVVVLKLLVNDLGNSGTVARIVSFLGVGAMLLLIGYVAPLPPGEAVGEGDGRG